MRLFEVPPEQFIDAQVSSSFAPFARSGTPQVPTLPTWPMYDMVARSTMIFDAACRVVDDPDGADRLAWSDLVAGV
ncbi:MAG: hypothetical protein AB7W59_07930 [Acidimicrobiia bacterium]